MCHHLNTIYRLRRNKRDGTNKLKKKVRDLEDPLLDTCGSKNIPVARPQLSRSVVTPIKTPIHPW